MHPRSTVILTSVWLAASCGNAAVPAAVDATTGSADQAGQTQDVTAGPAVEPALICPHPASLPLPLGSSGWATDAASKTAKAQPRDKDQAHDLLGAPGGVWFGTDLADAASPSNLPYVLRGVKARALADEGLDMTPLVGEWVAAWRSHVDGTWSQSARMATVMNGGYALTLAAGDAFAPGLHAAYAMLEAEPSCATHYALVRAAGAQMVVTDIDGTLTSTDPEFTHALVDASYDSVQMQGGAAMLQAWAQKGYPIVYLSARGHIGRAESRAWLDLHGFPLGVLITGETFANGEGARAYKRSWLLRMTKTLGWTFAAAYGNADSDVHAYADAGIDKARTFIVGPMAGTEGTVGIANSDYSAHTAAFVAAQPQAAAEPK